MTQVKGDLTDIVWGRRLSRATMRNIRQNFCVKGEIGREEYE